MSWLDRLCYLSAPAVGTFHIRTIPVRLATTNYLEYYRARTAETKEPDTLDWIDQFGGRGKCLYDVGANIGLYTLYALKRHPGMQVEAFEPYAPNREACIQNLSLNRVGAAVHSYALGASTGRGELRMVQPERGGTGTLIKNSHGVTRIKTLDACLAEGMPVPTMLKIDVDGHEWAVLQGAAGLLRNPRLETILVEITGDLRPISTILEAAGLVYDSRSAWTVYLSDGQPCQNVVFRRAA